MSEDQEQRHRMATTFKQEVNLIEYAMSCGFEYGREQRNKSSRSSKVLYNRRTGEKIVVSMNRQTGDWIYFNVHDDRDRGNIINFVRNRAGRSQNWTAVVNELTPWLGRAATAPMNLDTTIVPIERDRSGVLHRFLQAAQVDNSRYLNSRGLRPATLQCAAFQASWRVDRYGNVLFPHYDQEGLAGYEIKNRGLTVFAKGGQKALWQSAQNAEQRTLVLGESAVDLLSYHQLHAGPATRYVSIAGQLSPAQLGLVEREVAALGRDSQVILAVDADRGGDKIAALLQSRVEKYPVELRRHSPTMGKDWNEVLQHKERAFIQSIEAPERSPPRTMPTPGRLPQQSQELER